VIKKVLENIKEI